jgi:hypothetical protein
MRSIVVDMSPAQCQPRYCKPDFCDFRRPSIHISYDIHNRNKYAFRCREHCAEAMLEDVVMFCQGCPRTEHAAFDVEISGRVRA